MDYFERSQQVRREILRQPELLDAARLALTEKIESFASGSTTHIYWIGELESGVHVAMRKFKKGILDSIDEVTLSSDGIRHLETYCQNAEELDSMKRRV